MNTSTNLTPNEWLFNYQRWPGSTGRKVLPSWLINPGPVLLRNFEKSSKNDDLVKRVELLEANPHYALIKDQRGNTKTVSTQDLAPYPRGVVQNKREEQVQDYDELALEAANSKPRVLIPKLCLPNEILRSSESNNQDQDAKINESINTNENKDKEESSEIMETSSSSRGTITRSGRISRMPDNYEEY